MNVALIENFIESEANIKRTISKSI